MKELAITFPLSNDNFLKVVHNSFLDFLEKGSSQSNKKLKPLHGAIAEDLHRRLGSEYDYLPDFPKSLFGIAI